MARFPRWVGMFGALACVLMSGCIPNVVWLPDSSGFVFTETAPQDGPKAEKSVVRLVRYDVAKKKSQVLVPDLKGSFTTWTALSPDGKHGAVARFRWVGQVAKVRLVFYDLAGKEVRTTKEFEWARTDLKPAEGDNIVSLVFWPAPDKLLVLPIGNYLSDQMGIVHLDKSELMLVKDRQPYYYPGNIAGRPDCKGFLAMTKEPSQASFITWDGKETIYDVAPVKIRDCVAFRWEGAKAILEGPEETTAIDTAANAVTRTKSAKVADSVREGDQLVSRIAFSENRLEFRMLSWQPGAKDLRIEVRDQKSEKVRVLKERIEDPFAFASPDQKWIAVRTMTEILVIDAKGDIAATIHSSLR
jgi:hypothetical protein